MGFEFERWSESGNPDATVLRNPLQVEGYMVTECIDSPGTIYPLHSHNEDQSHWVISGELQLTIERETYTLSAGDRDFLPANTTNVAFVPGKEPVRYLIGVKHI